jgi:tRNA-specific 2-thiouridylase
MRPLPASVTLLDNDCFRVDFDEPAWAVAPGQAAVIYSGDEVLGGGTILASEGEPLRRVEDK